MSICRPWLCPDEHPVQLCVDRLRAEGGLSSPWPARLCKGRGVSPADSPGRSELANGAQQTFGGWACEGSYACELNHCAKERSLRAVTVPFFWLGNSVCDSH